MFCEHDRRVTGRLIHPWSNKQQGLGGSTNEWHTNWLYRPVAHVLIVHLDSLVEKDTHSKSAEEPEDLIETGVKIYGRPPTQHASGTGGVYGAAELFAWLSGAVLGGELSRKSAVIARRGG